MQRRRLPLGFLALLLVVLVACRSPSLSRTAASEAPAPPLTIPVSRGRVEQTVTAPGLAVSTGRWLATLPIHGRIIDLPVRAGQSVTRGQPLAHLDRVPLQQRLDHARERLARALTDHAFALEQAGLQREIAEAELAALESEAPGLSAETAALRAAQSRLDDLRAPSRPDLIAGLEAQVARATAELGRVEQGPSSESLIAAGAELANAEAALHQAQAAYDEVAWAADLSARPESLRLQQATNDYEAARARLDLLSAPPAAAEVEAARAALREAETRLAEAQRGPTTAEIAQAEAALAQAQAALQAAAARQAGNGHAFAAQQAGVELATRSVEALREGIDPEFMRAVTEAEADLAAATLVAPFDGVVVEVLATEGESLPAGGALLLLVDPGRIEVRTTVIEEDLPLIEPGQQVEVYFDAFSDVVSGRVARIVPERVRGEDRPLYHVFLDLERPPPGLVAGMTADAAVVIARVTDVLRLPRAVVRLTGETSGEVRRWVGGEIRSQPVTTGLRGDVYVEIVDGLDEGDEVVGE